MVNEMMLWMKIMESMYKMFYITIVISVGMIAFTPHGVVSLHYECQPRQTRNSGAGIANCSTQSLSHVPPNLPHNIRVLDLSNNIIRILSDNSFVKYEYLEILYMRNNSLTTLQPRAFARMRNLLYLDLSFNNLGIIPMQIFHDLTSLLTLSLQANRISTIPGYTFKNLSYLTNLFLAGNHIDNIHPEAFYDLSKLQRLELQNNALSKLDAGVVQYFTTDLKEVRLHNNRWFCDCNLRGMVEWLKNSSENFQQRLKWRFHSKEPTCRGPSLVKGRAFSSMSSESFLCPITMYSAGRNIEVREGAKAQLYCKYMSDPPVEVQWLKNGKLLQIPDKSRKYKVLSEGNSMTISELHIHNFRYEDIAEYQCRAENELGPAYISFLVTLEGVDPSTLLSPNEVREEDDKDRVRNAIIASATIGGVVFLLVIIGFIIFSILRCRRYRKKRKESIRMTFEEHLKANGIIESDIKKDTQQQIIYDEVPNSSLSIDGEMDNDQDSTCNSIQKPRNPSTNTNTYISFKSEFSEPEDDSHTYSTNPHNTYKSSDGSQCESTSPLLENISPILIDPNDPFYEANLYIPKRLYSFTENYLDSTQKSDIDPYISMRSQTLPHGYSDTEPLYYEHWARTMPHGHTISPYHMDVGCPPKFTTHSAPVHHKSASVGHLGINGPKKPPRLFHSRDSMSLHSQASTPEGDRDTGPKLSLPKPGSVDEYGTAV